MKRKNPYSYIVVESRGKGPLVPAARVNCIIRRTSYAQGSGGPIGLHYWATLRKSHIYKGKAARDDMFNSPEYTWCMDTESAPSITAAKNLARAYAKKLGVRIIRFDERM